MSKKLESLLDLHGKRALVTGASRGIGRAAAGRLALAGADLVVASRDEESIRRAAQEIEAQGSGSASAVAADIATSAGIAAIERAIGQDGVDLLVVSGGGPRHAVFDELDDDDWQTSFDLLLLSTVRLIRTVLPGMRNRKNGRIVVVLSSGVKSPIPGLILSNSLRGGVVGLLQSLSVELASDGILVNGVIPGRIDTDRVRSIDARNAQSQAVAVEEVRARSQRTIPLGRYGRPDEMADAILFLCSPMSTFVTGAMLEVDGGMVRTTL